MCQTKPTDIVYLILGITHETHINDWKNLSLQIFVTLEKKRLTTRYAVGILQRQINENFAWRLTASHLDKLVRFKRRIRIDVVVYQLGKVWTAGSGSLGIHYAEDLTLNAIPESILIPLKTYRNPIENRRWPALVATLSARSTPPSDGHIACLSESSAIQAAGPSSQGISKKSKSNLAKDENIEKYRGVKFKDPV